MLVRLLESDKLAERLLVPLAYKLLIEDYLLQTHEMLQAINLAARQLVEILKSIACVLDLRQES